MERYELINVIYLAESAVTSAAEMIVQPRNKFPILAFTGRLFQWSNPFRYVSYHGRRQPALLVMWTLLFIGYFPSKSFTILFFPQCL